MRVLRDIPYAEASTDIGMSAQVAIRDGLIAKKDSYRKARS
jgi:hypothetical protein